MAFTCVAGCPLAEPPKAARGLEGFDGFVTSAAAPIATGWSDQLSGQELHLLKIRAFSRRTATGRPIWPSSAEGGFMPGPRQSHREGPEHWQARTEVEAAALAARLHQD
jgi:hypothetical protein